MEKEKISNNELTALGVNDVEILISFSRVANGLLKHGVMPKPEILANLEALIDDPMPYALKKGGKFNNLAESIIAMRKVGKFIKQERSNFKLKEEIADFPVWGLEHIEVGALAQMRTAVQLPIAVAAPLCPMPTKVMDYQLVVYWQPQQIQLYLLPLGLI